MTVMRFPPNASAHAHTHAHAHAHAHVHVHAHAHAHTDTHTHKHTHTHTNTHTHTHAHTQTKTGHDRYLLAPHSLRPLCFQTVDLSRLVYENCCVLPRESDGQERKGGSERKGGREGGVEVGRWGGGWWVVGWVEAGRRRGR